MLTRDEMRAVIREEIAPLESTVQRIDTAIRGNGTPGLNQRVGSLEQSRTLHKKLWGAILSIIVAVVGAVVTSQLAG